MERAEEETGSGSEDRSAVEPSGTDGGTTHSSSHLSSEGAASSSAKRWADAAINRGGVAWTRRFAVSALGFLPILVVALVWAPPFAQMVGAVGIGISALDNAYLLWFTADARRYTRRRVWTYHAVGSLVNVLYFYALGAFGPYYGVLLISQYSTTSGFSSRISSTKLVLHLLGMGAMHIAILTGWIPNEGLLPSAQLGPIESFWWALAMQAIVVMTHLQASRTRKAVEKAIDDLETASRESSKRDALLQEAHEQLEIAAGQAGGLGRFSGQVVGSYQLGDVIGRGAMGEVYDAVSDDDGKTQAAVKLIRREAMISASVLERFRREIEIAKLLKSDHVVRVLEVGDRPLPYIAMERLTGQDLQSFLRDHGQLSLDDVIELGRQLSLGLSAAREAGIIHRDLKPSNILLGTPREGKPTWKIADFGVSKFIDAGSTATDALVGTPHYMSPEQAFGEELDHRVDVYGVGAIAYRALTGRPLFRGRGVAVLTKVMNDMPPRPSDLAEVNSAVDSVFAIVLAKTPASRFDRAESFVDALVAAQKGKLSSKLRGRARKLLLRHQWQA